MLQNVIFAMSEEKIPTERRLRRERAENFRLSAAAFDALSKLMRSRGASQTAARAVAVEGVPVPRAAAEAGIPEQTLRSALVRYRDAYDLARTVAGE